MSTYCLSRSAASVGIDPSDGIAWSPMTGIASRYSNTGAAEPTWRTVYTSLPSTSSVASPPQNTNAVGSMARMARVMRSGGRSKDSSSVRNPARRIASSRACT